MLSHPLFGLQVADNFIYRLRYRNPTPDAPITMEILKDDSAPVAHYDTLAEAERALIAAATADTVLINNTFQPSILRDEGQSDVEIACKLHAMINQTTSKVGLHTRRGFANVAVISPATLRWLALALTFGEEPVERLAARTEGGLVHLGTLRNGLIRVYMDPSLPATAPVLVGYTNERLGCDAGAFVRKSNDGYGLVLPARDDDVIPWHNYYATLPVAY